MSGDRPFEAGDVAFYAIEIHPSLGRAHEHVLTESAWIAANELAIEELGATRWLEVLPVQRVQRRDLAMRAVAGRTGTWILAGLTSLSS